MQYTWLERQIQNLNKCITFVLYYKEQFALANYSKYHRDGQRFVAGINSQKIILTIPSKMDLGNVCLSQKINYNKLQIKSRQKYHSFYLLI